MPSVASQHERHIGARVGSGQCVDYVRQVTGLPPTAMWRRGDPVQGADHAMGTAIATFTADGRYPNSMSGDSHTAILRATYRDGSIRVWDCWLGQPVHERVIHDRQGRGDAVNDASRFYTIELADDV